MYEKETRFRPSYDTTSFSFGIYFSEIPKKNIFNNFDYLVLYLKGDNKTGFTRSLNIELKDKKNTGIYTIDGITDKWQKFLVPLNVFTNIDLSKVNYLCISFPSTVVTKKIGRVYVDNIYLSKSVYEIKQKLGVNKIRTKMFLDSDFSEWEDNIWIKLDDKKNLEIGKITTDNDITAKFALQYDKNYLYLAVKVEDNEVVNRKTSEDIWREDCIEVFIDPSNDGFLWGDEKDFQIGFAPKLDNSEITTWCWSQQKEPQTNEIVVSRIITDRGYRFEIAISWNFLGINPVKKQKFGFSIAINDFDLKDGSSGKLNYCFIKEPFKEEVFLAEAVLK
jgi:hypothetical protein